MGILGRRKNKKYNYQPRFYKSEDGSKPFEMKGKFDDHRTTLGKNGLKKNFLNAVNDFNEGVTADVKKRLYIIITILILIFLWFIDFDLSIFKW
jgi:hypothetical protein